MHAQGDRPVLVVGAGPVGLAAALELARLHRPVRIVDAKLAPSTHSKAIGVNATGVYLKPEDAAMPGTGTKPK